MGCCSEIIATINGIIIEVIHHRIWNEPANALLVHLPDKSRTLSGMQGYRNVKVVVNCYIPQALWKKLLDPKSDWRAYYRNVIRSSEFEPHLSLDNATVLTTGVTMEHLAIKEMKHGNLWALALVTAGVESNALRIGVDVGQHHYPIGTINTIVVTSTELTQAAMASSFITATEAKVIALEDLGVKSSYTPAYQATGTGTDQIIIVSGKQERCAYVSGHTKIGELIAKAITAATKEAIIKRRKALYS